MVDDATTHIARLLPTREARLHLRFESSEWTIDRERAVVRFGRGRDNEVVIDDDYASRQHGAIRWHQRKICLDDQSSNGTFITRVGGRTFYLHQERIVLEGQGSIYLGRLEGPKMTFAVELLSEDGKTWRLDRAEQPPDESIGPGENVFRREGEYWTIAYEGTVLRVSDAKGLRYIAHLLRHAGEEFHVMDMAVTVADASASVGVPGRDREADLHVGDTSEVGPLLDPQAKATYKRRLMELNEELEDAERCNDLGRVTRAREEIGFLSQQLAAAVNFRGRDRPAGSSAERARVTVTLRVKDALKKLRQCHPALGFHLTTHVKTGRYCCYQPDPAHPISWTIVDGHSSH